MTSRALSFVVVSAGLLACAPSAAPACDADASDCPEARDGGSPADAEVLSPDGGSIIDFDAGTGTGTPACRNQFELCSSPADCCTPYACSGGTCR